MTFIWPKSYIPFLFLLQKSFLEKLQESQNNKVGSFFPSYFIDVIDPSIRERFNPCIFLGEYLMRNNAKYGTKLEYEDLFREWSQAEKLRRFFTLRRQKIFKHFTMQPYHNSFTFDLANGYVAALDKFLMLNGKLLDGFKIEDHFEETKGALSFDKFYEALQKWGITQKIISYDEITVVEKNPAFMAL